MTGPPYELRPIGHVESSLIDPATAPKQGYQGAPDAWLVFHPSMREGIRDLAVGDDQLGLARDSSHASVAPSYRSRVEWGDTELEG